MQKTVQTTTKCSLIIQVGHALTIGLVQAAGGLRILAVAAPAAGATAAEEGPPTCHRRLTVLPALLPDYTHTRLPCVNTFILSGLKEKIRIRKSKGFK